MTLTLPPFRRRLAAACGWALLLSPLGIRPAVAGGDVRQLTLATGTREPLVSTPERPGFAEEVARAALERLGITLVVVPLPVERALVNANAGIEDGDLFRAAGFEQDYPNLVQVPQPLMDQEFVALALRADVQVRDWPDLARYEVAHITGQKIIERRLQGMPNVTTVRDTTALLEMLVRGRADVAIHNRHVALLAAHQAGIHLRVLEPPLLRVPMYMYLHRRHQALAPRIAEALAEVRRDGTWQQLHARILAPLEPGR